MSPSSSTKYAPNAVAFFLSISRINVVELLAAARLRYLPAALGKARRVTRSLSGMSVITISTNCAWLSPAVFVTRNTLGSLLSTFQSTLIRPRYCAISDGATPAAAGGPVNTADTATAITTATHNPTVLAVMPRPLCCRLTPQARPSAGYADCATHSPFPWPVLRSPCGRLTGGVPRRSEARRGQLSLGGVRHARRSPGCSAQPVCLPRRRRDDRVRAGAGDRLHLQPIH